MTRPTESHRDACQTALQLARETIAACLSRTEAACLRTRLVLSRPPQKIDSMGLDLWAEIQAHIEAVAARAATVRGSR